MSNDLHNSFFVFYNLQVPKLDKMSMRSTCGNDVATIFKF